MNTNKKVLLGVLVSLASIACGGPNFNGIYSGSCTGCSGGSTINMTLYQQGSNVTGYWETTSSAGSFSATTNGSNLNSCTFTVVGQSPSSQGTLTLNNQNLSGTCGAVSVNLTQTR